MRRFIVSLSPLVLAVSAMTVQADTGKIHVCRAAGSTSTAKSVEIPAGSTFTVGDSAHHTVKTTEAAKLGAKCASIEASSAADPESQPIKQGKTPITAGFTLPGITLEGTVSRTFKPSAAASASTKTAPSSPTPATSAAKPTAKSPPASTSSGSATASKSGTGTAPTVSDAAAPAGSTAKCKDGTYSKSQHHSGTCSHHGGVAAWLNP